MRDNLKILFDELEEELKFWEKTQKSWAHGEGPEYDRRKYVSSFLLKQRLDAVKLLYYTNHKKIEALRSKLNRWNKPIEINKHYDSRITDEMNIRLLLSQLKMHRKFAEETKKELDQTILENRIYSEDHDTLMDLLEELYADKISSILFFLKDKELYVRLSKDQKMLLLEIIEKENKRHSHLYRSELASLYHADFVKRDDVFQKRVEFNPDQFYEIVGLIGFVMIEVFKLVGDFEIVVKE